MNPEHLQYFKDLIEGKDVESWYRWWKTNDTELKSALSRQRYLRLKFGRVAAASEILKELGIAHQWTARGRQQAAVADLHPDAVDENGYPLPAIREQAYEGAIAAFAKGDREQGQHRLQGFLAKLQRETDEIQRAEELADLEFDGEQLWREGQEEAAIAILQALARWETDSDLEMPAVRYAQEKLRDIGRKAGTIAPRGPVWE